MARPLRDINWDVVERLIESGCNGIEIAGKFRMQKQTFYRRFEDEYGESFQNYRTKPQEAGKADIKAMLHAKALNNSAPGNAQLLMFLGKCVLGMKEPELLNTIPANQSVIDKDQRIMELEHKLSQLEIHAHQSKTE